MKTSLALVSSLGILALTACSSQLEKETASGNYDYLETQQSGKLKIPEGLEEPDYSDDYALPPVGEQADTSLLGRNITVKSPPLVLPLVTGSHVEEGSRSATVLFDQVDDSQPLDKAIWNSLLSYLDRQQIGVDKFEPETGTLVTDWMLITSDEDSAWYDWSSSEEKQVGRRFEFNLTMKPHGRSASLSVNLRDYMATRGDDVDAEVNELEERREEVAILNQVITHYEYQIQLEDSRRMARIREGLDTEMGFNADGEPAYVVSATYDVAWPRLLLVMRKMGFDVKDLDKSTGLIFVSYTGDNESWWNNWFGSDEELLEEDDYRLKVAEAGPEKTVITFMNQESEPFEANQVSDLYKPFAEVMAEDNLDI
ncbi:outer membrane protein assembly factor BamC [Alteromonas halophila]|uniref:Outer membrane protein assembly factor BamC n=1 Tax=Alteromonas halophila TaxID=516698 RepID=A0A918JQG8_9ALTE|nr:outer membrane protein assembly factor BamC [Alteromonas halophila]GGW97219.1 outer membrane protein assembly factor BamC [Alteromonas halophila]